MNSIEKKIKIYEKKKEEALEIQKEIDRQYKEFEDFIRFQKKELRKSIKKFNKYREDNIVKVRLGDFIDALSSLIGEKRDYFSYRISTNVSSVGENCITEDMTQDKKWKYAIYDKPQALLFIFTKDDKYNYFFHFDLNLDEIQCDNKKMLEHCSASFKEDPNPLLAEKTYIVIDKDIDDVIISFNFDTLIVGNEDFNLIIQTLNVCDEIAKTKVKKLGGIYE